MSKSDFDAFVANQLAKQKKEAAAFNPEQQLREWLDYLDALYKEIEKFLAEYTKNGSAHIEYFDIQLNEEFIGSYTARKLILRIGHSTITFTPIGTVLIGTKGRVDIKGPFGGARLGLVDKNVTSGGQLIHVTTTEQGQPSPAPPSSEAIKNIDWVWKIMTPPPAVRFIDLTQQSFFDTVLKIANAQSGTR